MKKTLIITAHPSTQGFVHTIANHYAQAIKDNQGQAEILDLYAPENHQPFLTFETETKWPQEKLEPMHKKISTADEIVIVFPVWWGEAPAILKNWIDYNFTRDFAYKFTPKGVKKLLKGKTTKVIATADGPGFIYGGVLSPMRLTWQHLILGFCGLKVTTFKVYGKMRKRSEKNRNQILEEIKKLASK